MQSTGNHIQLKLFETWKKIPGFYPYKISTFGRLQKYDKIKKIQNNRDYNAAYVIDSNIAIHILVALTFIGPRPKGLTINHIDGNHHNNRLDNLEYLTYSGNVYHGKIIHNRSTSYDQSIYKAKYREERRKSSPMSKQTRQIIKEEQTTNYVLKINNSLLKEIKTLAIDKGIFTRTLIINLLENEIKKTKKQQTC